MQFWQNEAEQLAAYAEQLRRETERSLHPSDESVIGTDEYKSAQRRKQTGVQAFFEAMKAHGDQQESPLDAVHSAIEKAIAPSRGKPNHLKKLTKLLAEHQLTQEQKRKPALQNADKATLTARTTQISQEIATALLAVIAHDMIFEILQIHGSEFNDRKQLNAEKLTQRITTSVQLEILLRLDLAVSRKTALQAQNKSAYLNRLNLDQFMSDCGIATDDLMITIKSLIEVIAEMTGLFEVSEFQLAPTTKLLDMLKDQCHNIPLYAIHSAMPMIYPPLDWQPGQAGGRLRVGRSIDKIVPTNALLKDWKALITQVPMPLVYKTINALQQTAWRINLPVLTVVKQVYSERQNHPRLAEKFNKATGNALSKDSKPERMVRRRVGADTQQQLNYQLLLADLEKQPMFWYPWSLDARGRMYPQAPWLNIQGDDLARGLLCFADSKPVTSDEARHYLAVHGSQFVKKSIMKRDLALNDELNLSAHEREKWIAMHEAHIIASATAPLTETWWCDVADDELWQFLAFCIAWKTMREGKPIALPVMMDGSCNGLQHMAALTRSPLIAKQTNLTDNARPEDVYTYVKQAVQTHLENPTNIQYPFIKDFILQQPAFMDRKIAKSVVIGFSYGSRRYKDHIANALKRLALFEQLNRAQSPIEPVLTEFITTLYNWEADGAQHIERSIKFKDADTLKTIQDESELSDELNDEDNDTEAEAETSSLTSVAIESHKFYIRPNLNDAITALTQQQLIGNEHEKKHRAVLSGWLVDRLASYLSGQFEQVMNAVLCDAVALMDWLGQFPSQCRPLPTMWASPVGFPVIQPKFETHTRDIESTLYGIIYREMNLGKTSNDTTRIRKREDKLSVNIRSQNTAIPPNFIHSLDASHLMMTVDKAHDAGIRQFAMVHDSFGTHAQDAPLLAQCLREAFVDLHQQPLLSLYRQWFNQLQQVLATKTLLAQAPTEQAIQALVIKWMAEHSEALAKKSIEPQPDNLPYAKDAETFSIDTVLKARYFFA